MDYLSKILGVNAPGNMEFVSREFSLRSNFPWWLALLFVIVLGVGVFILYLMEQGTLGWFRRTFLVLLRTVLIALLVLLILRPVLLASFRGERPRPIVVLLDVSQSMKQHDRRMTNEDKLRVAIAKNLKPLQYQFTDLKSASDLPADLPIDPARTDMVKWILTHPDLKLVENLEKQGPVRPMIFGALLRGPDEESANAKDSKAKTNVNELLLASLSKSEDAKTALKDSINELLQKKDAELPAAMVIITDGQDNSSKYFFEDIGQECKRLQVPLFIYGVGSSEAGSLQLKEVIAPETIFVDDTLPVLVRWAAQGFKKGTVEIEIKLGGKIVAKKDLDVQTGQDLRQLLSFKIEKGYKKDEPVHLETTIQLKGSDVFKDKITRQVRVVDDQIRVLVIENSPRFEFKFLQPALDPAREKRFTTKFLLVNADPKVANDPNSPYILSLPPTREKFFEAKYNVIILGDVSPKFLTKEQQEWIKEFVQKRGGLIVVAGRQHMPADYADMPLAEVLPVDLKGDKNLEFNKDPYTERPLEYPPTLTPDGQRSDMLMLDDTPEENLKVWQALPGFYWFFPVNKLRPGATPLVVNPRKNMANSKQQMPLIVTQFYGQGQVLFAGTDETWRWRFNVQDKYFVRYWGQLIYQMGLPHLLGDNGKRALFSLENSEAKLKKNSKVFVKLFDKEFNPRKDEKVEAELFYLDSKKAEKPRPVNFLKMPGRDGDYYVTLDNNQPGRFELKLKNQGVTEVFSYRVEIPPGDELEEAGLNEKALRNLAKDSGGKFYREENLFKLADDMKNEFTVVLESVPVAKEETAQAEQRERVTRAVSTITGMGFKEAQDLVAGAPKAVKENVSKEDAEKYKRELEQAGGQAIIRERKVPFTVRQEVVLWNPLVMLIFVGLITVEWLVRKFSNLS